MFGGLSAYINSHDLVGLKARACEGWWDSSAGPLDSPEWNNVKRTLAIYYNDPF